jgi:hypothetical protein
MLDLDQDPDPNIVNTDPSLLEEGTYARISVQMSSSG